MMQTACPLLPGHTRTAGRLHLCRHQQEQQQVAATLAGLGGPTQSRQPHTRPSLRPDQQAQQGRTAAPSCWASP